MTTTSKLLTAGQVAELLGVSAATVYQMSYRGQLPGRVKIGARVRFREDLIAQVVEKGLPLKADAK